MVRKRRPHDDSGYRRRRAALLATATPATLCARCGKPGHAHPQRYRTGKPAGWHADHLIPGRNDGPLALSWGTCNMAHGGEIGNERRWGQNGGNRTSGPPAGWEPGPHHPMHHDLDNLTSIGAPPCAQHSGRLCQTCAEWRAKNPTKRG
jgi:hypothetical protein